MTKRLQVGVAVALALLLLPCFTRVCLSAEDSYARRRERMVRDDIERRGVKAPDVFRAMRAVLRHKFVSRSQLWRAYADHPLPIGYGQTISQPYIVAAMTKMLEVDADDVVLEIGTGSGYQAAVLAEIVAHVYTIEIIKQLGASARERLEDLGYDNITVKIGDGYYGWKEHAPFDAIIVTAAPSHIPPPLIEQLKPGGKMVIPVGPVTSVQYLMLVEKGEDGSVTQRNVMPVRFVPLTGDH